MKQKILEQYAPPDQVTNDRTDVLKQAAGTVITKLAFKKMTPMVTVWLDDALAFTCHLDLVLKHQLETGRVLSPENVNTILADQAALEAWHKALRYALSKTRTTAEVRRYLQSKEADEALITEIIGRLRRDYELDDHKAAKEYFEQNRSRMGNRRIRSELLRRGVSSSTADAVISGPGDGCRAAEELETALLLARKKLESDQGVDPRKAAMRVVGLLQRKGYGTEVIRKVADALELKLY
ncbi:regulatory protein RecX [Acidaminobacter hydrogenoformans]|uniref:Regulatory protein RecX n=1 Tax=Acidaminobacter hydrogenoformans DSM 2784 TaxID=1120920 RepID=A0A1G5RXY4_9FIRM|nr:RecX family transcriptional regulator [Acidaminobacter hydrogenoformans]SCZ78903.1 RecX family protein [Acidaminobacter hydrogenoformans DSM 2784]